MKIYQDRSTMEKLYEKHHSAEEIAKELKIGRNTVYTWLKKLGIKNTIGSQGARRHSLDIHFFDEINTEMKAYWLGFIMADGCVYHGSDANSYRLQINLQTEDKYILEAFIHDLQSDYSIIDKVRSNKENDKEYFISQLKINCTYLCQQLMKHGISLRKSGHCVLPDMPKELVRHFIRGYFDGDGCISWKNQNPGRCRIDIVGGEKFLRSIQSVLEAIDASSSIYKCTASDKVKQLAIVNLSMIEKLYHLMYDDASFYMKRKYDRFQTFLSYMSRRTEMFGQ